MVLSETPTSRAILEKLIILPLEFGRIIKSQFILTYLDDVKLRQRIEKQLNRIETSNKFAKAIFYANNSEFKKADLNDQNIAVACKVLIQNSIVLWNYLYLSEILTNCNEYSERMFIRKINAIFF